MTVTRMCSVTFTNSCRSFCVDPHLGLFSLFYLLQKRLKFRWENSFVSLISDFTFPDVFLKQFVSSDPDFRITLEAFVCRASVEFLSGSDIRAQRLLEWSGICTCMSTSAAAVLRLRPSQEDERLSEVEGSIVDISGDRLQLSAPKSFFKECLMGFYGPSK